MSFRRVPLALAVYCVAIVACSESPSWNATHRVDFSELQEQSAEEAFRNYPSPLWFESGFSSRQGSAIWTEGDSATVMAYVRAESLRVELRASTHPDLSRLGQGVRLLVDGTPLGDFDLDRGWEQQTFVARSALADANAESHAIQLVPRLTSTELESNRSQPRALGVFLQSISIDWFNAAAPTQPDSVPPLDPRADLASLSVHGELPDVLFIVLDAARPDHLPCYGYGRQTTPAISRLAEDALVMTSAFAVSPFTLNSTASLFTGLSWATHGVVEKDMALSEEFVTLAEALGAAGYRTHGISDNPFVGDRTRLSQGFDGFDEAWLLGARDETAQGRGRAPETVARLFRDRLAEGLDDAPYFFYLHVMPPHSPYRPGPTHDLWAHADDPPGVDGSVEYLDSIHEGKLQPDARERQRLVSLYDGNLHRADAIVDSMLRAFRRLGRSRELRVVVTSDHGEAFGEHGRYEHLSDVHDEMTRIPLVLWPRAAWAEALPSPDALLANSDLYPLLLESIGIGGIAAQLDHSDVRKIDASGRFHSRAHLLLRANEEHHRFGIRSTRRLSISAGHRDQRMYDVVADPLLKHNRRGLEAGLFAEDMRTLRDLMNQLRAIDDLGGSRTVIDEEATEALKALGYVD